MNKNLKLIIGLVCLAIGLLYHYLFQGDFVIIDQEITDFSSGFLVGLGFALTVAELFAKKRKNVLS